MIFAESWEGAWRGATICVRYPEGPEKRGGYFFHFAPKPGAAENFSFMILKSARLRHCRQDFLVAFINHCTDGSSTRRLLSFVRRNLIS